jgi:1,4-dihydroxy-2-naphthoate octaprenyltransferase
MDNDTGSIGGLKNPPPATVKLYYASIIMDTIGLILCLFVNLWLIPIMLVYVAVSKAYSWRRIRIKKYAVLSWLVVVLFQGGFTFMLVNMCAENEFNILWFSHKNIECMIIASLLIGGFYPLTQIYQHEEDSSRGDFTISYKLGIAGTFVFSAAMFLMASSLCFNYFSLYYSIGQFWIFSICLFPVTAYFLYWFVVTISDRSMADFGHSMRMTIVSSLCMIICFGVIFFTNHMF